MFGGFLTGRRIDRSHELRVAEELLEHARMLTAHRAVHHGAVRSLGDGSRRPNPYRAVDDCQARAKELDIAGGLTDEVSDFKWVAHVHDIDTLHWLGWRRDVRADH